MKPHPILKICVLLLFVGAWWPAKRSHAGEVATFVGVGLRAGKPVIYALPSADAEVSRRTPTYASVEDLLRSLAPGTGRVTSVFLERVSSGAASDVEQGALTESAFRAVRDALHAAHLGVYVPSIQHPDGSTSFSLWEGRSP